MHLRQHYDVTHL